MSAKFIPTQPEEDEAPDVYDDYCYECGAYGDDYHWDEETEQLVSNCPGCPFNNDNETEDD